MADNLGTAHLYLSVDTTEFRTRLEASKNLAGSFGEDAKAAFDKADAGAKRAAIALANYVNRQGLTTNQQKLMNAEMQKVPATFIDAARKRMDELADATRQAAENAKRLDFVDSMRRQAEAVGKTRSELLAMKAAELGVEAEVAPFIAKLREQENALYGTTTQLNKYGLSAKQVAFAMRGVPAQVTDIFVSLQGGQNPLTVLLQQGGQLKDMFGGIVPAARAMGSAILGLINPFTIAAGAMAVVAAAWFVGEKETNAYRQAIALTGNQAGVTTAQLQTMAVALTDNVTTQHAAAAALAEVTKSGKFTADQIQLVAEAAVNMERATGQAVSKTVDQFAELANKPTEAVVKLNAETHFLTDAVYQQVRALEEQGRTQDAATLAMRTYADTVNERTGEVEENLGTLQTAWRGIIGAAKAAWDAMLDVGREDTTSDRIRDLGTKLDALKNNNLAYLQYGNIGSEARKEQIRLATEELRGLLKQERDDNRRAYTESETQKLNDYVITQREAIRGHRSADQKRADEIARSEKEANLRIAQANKLGQAELAKSIRENQDAYVKALQAEGKKKGKGDGGLANAETRADLQEFKDALSEKQAALANDSRLLQAQYGAQLITASQYFAELRRFNTEELSAQEGAIQGQIDALRNRNATGKDAINIQRQLHTLESQLAAVRAKSATDLAIININEQEYNDKQKEAIEDYRTGLDRATAALQRQQDAIVGKIGMGEAEYAQAQRLADIYRQQAEELEKLNRQKARGEISPERYQQEVQALEQATDAQVAVVEDGYKRMLEEQSKWQNGVRAGLADWLYNTANVAQQVKALTTKVLDSATDALVQFATTGKVQWREMLADIGKELVKFFAKKAVMQFIQYIIGAWAGGGAGAGGSASSIGGNGVNMDGFAKGDSFTGSPSLSAYSNQVVTQPTPFYFAKGAGIMGEAGAEAVMPLTRTKDGNLGVRALGGGGNITVNINTNVTNEGSDSGQQAGAGDQSQAIKEFTERMQNVARAEIQNQMRPGGALWKVGVTVQ